VRGRLILALGLAAIAGGVAAGLVFALGEGAAAPTRAEYVARVNALCAKYGERLDRIRPPDDPASLGAAFESMSRALPVLRQQSAEARKLKVPTALRPRVERFLELTDRSLEHLEEARRHAEARELFKMVQTLSAFQRVRNQAKRVARSIGFRC
jgi:hypothetical protein